MDSRWRHDFGNAVAHRTCEVAKEFLLWYADYQFANGKIPCCVDVRGADPVPENDSGGEFLFLVERDLSLHG